MSAIVLFGTAGHVELIEFGGTQNVEHQQAVVGGDRAPRLAHDHRVRHVACVADALDAVHHVARVFVERVVHRGFVVGAAAVVIHAQPAADIDILQPRAHELELRIDVREFVDRVLDAADVLQLAARMAVHELQAIEHLALFEQRVKIEDLADEQPELRFFAGRFAPSARTLGRELDPHAELRPHAVVLRMLQKQVNFLEVFDDRNDRAAELGREDYGLDVAVVLEAVADDDAIRRILGDRHDGEQLGLRSDLETEAELLAVAINFLDHEALLVDLDRKNRRIAVLVIVFHDRGVECIRQMAQAMREDVGKSNHDRRVQIARLESLDDVVEIDLVRCVHTWADDHVAITIDREIALAPGLDLIQVQRVLDLPNLVREQLLCGNVHVARTITNWGGM